MAWAAAAEVLESRGLEHRIPSPLLVSVWDETAQVLHYGWVHEGMRTTAELFH
jgi:hypothetical protein